MALASSSTTPRADKPRVTRATTETEAPSANERERERVFFVSPFSSPPVLFPTASHAGATRAWTPIARHRALNSSTSGRTRARFAREASRHRRRRSRSGTGDEKAAPGSSGGGEGTPARARASVAARGLSSSRASSQGSSFPEPTPTLPRASSFARNVETRSRGADSRVSTVSTVSNVSNVSNVSRTIADTDGPVAETSADRAFGSRNAYATPLRAPTTTRSPSRSGAGGVPDARASARLGTRAPFTQTSASGSPSHAATNTAPEVSSRRTTACVGRTPKPATRTSTASRSDADPTRTRPPGSAGTVMVGGGGASVSSSS